MAPLRTKTTPAITLLLAFGMLHLPSVALSQDLVPRPASDASPTVAQALPFAPEFSKGREFLLTGVGAGLFVSGALYPIDKRVVPVDGRCAGHRLGPLGIFRRYRQTATPIRSSGR